MKRKHAKDLLKIFYINCRDNSFKKLLLRLAIPCLLPGIWLETEHCMPGQAMAAWAPMGAWGGRQQLPDPQDSYSHQSQTDQELAKGLECEQKNLGAGISSRKCGAERSLSQGKALLGRRTPSAPHAHGISCGMSPTEASTPCTAFKRHLIWQLEVAPPIRQAKNRGKITLCWRQWESCHWLRPGPGLHSRIFFFFRWFIIIAGSFTVKSPLCPFSIWN